MLQQQQQQQQQLVPEVLETPKADDQREAVVGDAPPKQVAVAMERLGLAARLVADIRLDVDRLVEAFLSSLDSHLSDSDAMISLASKISLADSSMRQHLQDLRALGRLMEESGILKSRGNTWSLHMPLVCPDSSVVAYAWKRQLAGHAGASAVDRTRLALRAFMEQKKRYFPHLEDNISGHHNGAELEVSKRPCYSHFVTGQKENFIESRTLSDILTSFEKESAYMKVYTYQRVDWLKRASSLVISSSNSVDQVSEQDISNKSRPGHLGSTAMDQVAVIELTVPLVFRAVLSLHPAGSVNPASVAFFSPDEGGNYIHSRGTSVYHMFKHITNHADKALQYFQSAESHKALSLLLHWIYGYHTLFSKVCSKCQRLIAMDRSLGLLLPPIYYPYQRPSAVSPLSSSAVLTKELILDHNAVFHLGCCVSEQ